MGTRMLFWTDNCQNLELEFIITHTLNID